MELPILIVWAQAKLLQATIHQQLEILEVIATIQLLLMLHHLATDHLNNRQHKALMQHQLKVIQHLQTETETRTVIQQVQLSPHPNTDHLQMETLV